MGLITLKQMLIDCTCKDVRRGLLGLEDCVQVEVHSFEQYLSTSKEKILKEVGCSRIIENNKYRRSKEEIHK